MKICYLLILSTLILSCGSDPEPEDDPNTNLCVFEDKELSGEVLNNSYQLSEGTASYYDNGDEYQIFFFGTDELIAPNPCDITGIQGSQITIFVNNKVEEGNTVATLYNAATMDLKTASCCYSVNEITSSSITGQLTIEDLDNGNSVSGSWEVLICD